MDPAESLRQVRSYHVLRKREGSRLGALENLLGVVVEKSKAACLEVSS